MGKCCDHSSAFIFELIFFSFAGYKYNYTGLIECEFGHTPPLTNELAVLWRLKIDDSTIDLILFKLAGNKTCIISWMSSNFGLIN